MKVVKYNFKKEEYSSGFQQIFNKYLKHQKNLKLNIELVYNPSKLFIEDIYQKKIKYDMQKENMNIFNDLFDGKTVDIDLQKYLNYKGRNAFDFRTHSTNKISQFLLLKKSGKFLNSKNKKMHKSFSQNIFSKNNNKKEKLRFPQIFPNENEQNKFVYKNARNLTINTDSFLTKNKDNYTINNKTFNIKKPIIRVNNKKLTKYTRSILTNNSKVFNAFKTKYYNKMNLLTTDSKFLSKNLSNAFTKEKAND